METMLQSWLTNAWGVPAACDVVALLALVAIVRLTGRTRSAATLQFLPGMAPADRPVVPPPPEAGLKPPEDEPVARADVKRALDAIGRWEHSYRSGRGVAELARFVNAQRAAREDVPVR